MKFNCDRCKTRYSISDERVRGKVLKIRCKNCSAVITVREGMVASAPPTPRAAARAPAAASPAASFGGAQAAPARAKSESALRGAFDDAMRAPSAADSMTGPPAQLTTEWYLAVNGDQSGPFDLAGATVWINQQAASVELYCWSEGFDDWLPIDKVSQFRGVRKAKNGAHAGGFGLGAVGSETPMPSLGALASTAASTVEREPQPLFAATMKQVAAEAPTLLEDDDPMSPHYHGRAPQSAEPGGGGFEIDIGEASRVVNLASLMSPSAGIAGPMTPSAGLPGMGGPAPTARPMAGFAGGPVISGATSPEFELPRPEVLAPKPSGSRLLVPLLLASSVLVVVLGVLLFLAFSRSASGGEEEIARGGASGAEGLAKQYDQVPRSGSAVRPEAEDGGADAIKRTKVIKNGTRRGSGGTGDPGYTPNDGEVDLSMGVTSVDVKQGSLDPGDISSVYRKKQFSVNRCYERAIKRNPLLKVGKTFVTPQVAESGEVSKISIPSLVREELGSCLVATIGRWRFPKSTEGFRGSFPILFKRN